MNTIRINLSRLKVEFQGYRNKSTVRIGCASGFWGDTQVSVPQLIHKGHLDYLVFDYLSEITMSLLASSKRKNPELGYISEFVLTAMIPYLKDIKSRGIRVVSNAGALNPRACASYLAEEASKKGIDLKIAAVTGDDLMPLKNDMKHVREMDTNKPFPMNEIITMNVYFGAKPISEALKCGADVVITGRCVDSAIVLGPLLHEFKWKPNDWEKLAAGSLAGHVIECGPQCTGGIFTDWDTVPDWHNIGFPIIECQESGEFNVRKPDSTGGIITFGSVAEQILYEVHDPSNYELPDVICDFSTVKLEEIRGGVKVTGVKGKPPSSKYKVNAIYADGFRSTAVCPIIGPSAREKALKAADSILKRCKMIFEQMNLEYFTKVKVEVLGSGANYASVATDSELKTREAVLWIAVSHINEVALKIFSKEIAAAGTGMAPGFTSLIGGRPKITPILKLYSFLYPKVNIQAEIWMNNETVTTVTEKISLLDVSHPHRTDSQIDNKVLKSGNESYSLKQLAYTRSGDKGDTANIAVIARHPAFLPYIKSSLTEEAVAKYFQHLFETTSNPKQFVSRYDAPGLNAVNFVLRNSLGGGGVASLHSDPQGKALGQILLDFTICHMPPIESLLNEHKTTWNSTR